MKKNTKGVLLTGLIMGAVVIAALWVLFSMFPKYNGSVCKVTKLHRTGAAKEMVFFKGHKKIATYYLDQQGAVVRIKGGTPEGLFGQYYPNGRLLSKDNYVRGRLSGLRVVYRDTGSIQVRETYKDGKLFGVRKIYSEKGKLVCQQLFANGRLEGLTRLYDERGDLLLTLPYERGVMDGEMVLYAGAQVPAARWTYDNGALNGPATIFYGKDTLLAKDTYAKGRLLSRKLYSKAQSCVFAQTVKKYPRTIRTVRKNGIALFLNYPVATQDRLLTRYDKKARVLAGFMYDKKGRVTGTLKVSAQNGKPLFLENYKNGLVVSREVYGKDGEPVYKETPRPSSGQAR